MFSVGSPYILHSHQTSSSDNPQTFFSQPNPRDVSSPESTKIAQLSTLTLSNWNPHNKNNALSLNVGDYPIDRGNDISRKSRHDAIRHEKSPARLNEKLKCS